MLFIRKRLRDPLATKDSTMSRGRPKAARVEWAFQHHVGGQRHTGGLFPQLHSYAQKKRTSISMLSISARNGKLSVVSSLQKYLHAAAAWGLLKNIFMSVEEEIEIWIKVLNKAVYLPYFFLFLSLQRQLLYKNNFPLLLSCCVHWQCVRQWTLYCECGYCVAFGIKMAIHVWLTY